MDIYDIMLAQRGSGGGGSGENSDILIVKLSKNYDIDPVKNEMDKSVDEILTALQNGKAVYFSDQPSNVNMPLTQYADNSEDGTEFIGYVRFCGLNLDFGSPRLEVHEYLFEGNEITDSFSYYALEEI